MRVRPDVEVLPPQAMHGGLCQLSVFFGLHLALKARFQRLPFLHGFDQSRAAARGFVLVSAFFTAAILRLQVTP
jgi:hypothetical protein